MQHDAFFYIGIFVFIFILWLVLGGPSRPLSFSGPLLSGPDAVGGGTYLSFPHAPNPIGGSSITGSHASGGSSSGSAGTGTTKKPTNQLSQKDQQAVTTAIKTAAFGPPSPSRGFVTLSHSISGAGSANAQTEYIQLSVSSNAPGPITLTGWSIGSEVSGKSATIPKGTEVPRSGIINASQPIVLNPGDRAIISSGRSPIGASFRENICMGYFSQFQTFKPSLSNSCPLPKTDLAVHYGAGLVQDPLCSDYVEKLSRCKLTLSPPPTLSSACQRFVTTYLNYNGCVATHEQDYNFKNTTWRIYLGRDSSMWRTSREVVKLFDATGKTVDMFTY